MIGEYTTEDLLGFLKGGNFIGSEDIDEFSDGIRALRALNAIQNRNIPFHEAMEGFRTFISENPQETLNEREKLLVGFILYFSEVAFINKLITDRYCYGILNGESVNISFLNKICELLISEVSAVKIEE